MQLTVISGKGGTGKTTIAAAIAELERASKVDCDVDAPNLYLYFPGKELEKEGFSGGKKAVVNEFWCDDCGLCQQVCKFDAIENGRVFFLRCEGCGACSLICPQKTITLVEEKTAQALVSKTANGYLAHSKMEIGSEGSGKLITVLRKKAQEYAADELIINDGSPGIGCSVISSITATDAVLIVTEPTQSGVEDLKRVVELCRQFGIKTFVCINKADINEEKSQEVEDYCQANGLVFTGRIPYDETVIQSINELQPITNYQESEAAKAIVQVWNEVKSQLPVELGKAVK